jgi:hypothetical protein
VRHARRLAACCCVVAGLAAACSDDAPQRSVAGFCDAAAELEDVESLVASLDHADVAAAAEAFDHLADVAPDEVRADAEVLRDAIASLADAMEVAPADPEAAVEEALRDPVLSQAAVEVAGEAVEGYAAANCGIDLTPESTTSTTGVPGVADTITGLD